ncbi:MAG: PEP-CTERM sorting domain-containing protein [Thiobacillus sp.]|nr:PEP-CTERM sorting domain-containing protein [Thiobacillus sp.]
MKFNRIHHHAFVILLLAGLMPSAQAAGYCSLGAASEGIDAGDVTFNGVSASDCFGVVGDNITGSGATVLNGMSWGDGWTYFDATDAAGASFLGMTFTTAATPGSSGSWTLAGIDANGVVVPLTLDLVVGLKAGNEYALWGFDNVVVDGSGGGVFNVAFTNNGGTFPALSHLIVFGRDSGGGSVSAIPEPDAYAMLLAGLGLVGFAVRRKLR